jgi:hypothetical protein
MSESREFRLNKDMVFFQVAKGEIELDEESFKICNEELKSPEFFEDRRNVLGEEFLEILKFVEDNFVYYKRDLENFIEDPKTFSLRLLPGSNLEKCLRTLKNLQCEINTLFGYYTVSVNMLDYLKDENKDLEIKNNTLKNKNEELTNELKELNEKYMDINNKYKDLLISKDNNIKKSITKIVEEEEENDLEEAPKVDIIEEIEKPEDPEEELEDPEEELEDPEEELEDPEEDYSKKYEER